MLYRLEITVNQVFEKGGRISNKSIRNLTSNTKVPEIHKVGDTLYIGFPNPYIHTLDKIDITDPENYFLHYIEIPDINSIQYSVRMNYWREKL